MSMQASDNCTIKNFTNDTVASGIDEFRTAPDGTGQTIATIGRTTVRVNNDKY